ncbi:uncharacterized protein [Panulirus ornatus]|uniref:uncharacterized protein isoform X3 n=1 Tax=Panulirus ornatus TaxID=150431 RepID=UPI003A8B6012
MYLCVEMESLREKDWKRQQRKSSGQRTNMFLTLQDIQCIFYILVYSASVAAKNQTRLEDCIDLKKSTRDASYDIVGFPLKVDLESLKEKDWKRQQQESSWQRTHMFLTLQDLQ